MFEFLLAMMAAGLSAGTPSQTAPVEVAAAAPAPALVDGFDMSVVPAGLTAEPQTPVGKFTTALEVKPILGATKGNWVAVREYDGQDLVYVTHLWAWRCGLFALAVSVNDAPLEDWPLPACHDDTATPNAILPDDGLPYSARGLGTVQTVTVQIVYDDLSMERASFDRGSVLLP